MQDLNQYALIFEQAVVWGDMDAFGHLNNVMYYRYMESARLDYFEKIDLFAYKVLPVVRSNECEYLRPVYYPDQLKIAVRVMDMRNSSFTMDYLMWSELQQSVVATGKAVMVCIDPETKNKKIIPEQLKEKINTLEK
jgi:acyl-CoA thioester hydrolase